MEAKLLVPRYRRVERAMWRVDTSVALPALPADTTGDAIQFLMSVEGLRFMQAVEWLAKECDLRLEPPQ